MLKKTIFEELVKNGYSKINGNKGWDISKRHFLYLTPELAKGFLKLKEFPRYKEIIVDSEIKLMKEALPSLVEKFPKTSFNLIDIYCGEGKKAISLLSHLKGDLKIRYCPLNPSEYLANLAQQNVANAGIENVTAFKVNVSDCEQDSVRKFISSLSKDKSYEKNVVLLLGSILSSYDINDYLYHLSKSMKKGDYLIFGNGIRMGERLASLNTYKHPIWNEWFKHLMTGIGFSEKDLSYDARFGNSRVEMFYTLLKDKTLEHEGSKIEFKAGDEVMVAKLYKYYYEELDKFCKMYFSDVKMFKDKQSEYVLVLCQK